MSAIYGAFGAAYLCEFIVADEVDVLVTACDSIFIRTVNDLHPGLFFIRELTLRTGHYNDWKSGIRLSYLEEHPFVGTFKMLGAWRVVVVVENKR